MIKTLLPFRLSSGQFPSGRTKPEREDWWRSAGCLCVAGSADDLRKSASVWMGLRVTSTSASLLPPLSTPSLSLSVLRSLSLPSDVLGDTSTHGTHKNGVGLSERRDSGIITSDNYSTDSIVRKVRLLAVHRRIVASYAGVLFLPSRGEGNVSGD